MSGFRPHSDGKPMSSSLSTLGFWLLRKFSMITVVAAAGLATGGLWLFVHDDGGYEKGQAVLAVRCEELRVKADSLGKQTAAINANIAAQEQRMTAAAQVIKTLKSFNSTWDRLIWNREQQHAYDEQTVRMRDVEKTASAELVRLRREGFLSGQAENKARGQLTQAERALGDRVGGISIERHYLNEAWHQGRWYIVVVSGAYLLGPSILFFGLYCWLAPFVSRRRPMRLTGPLPAISTASTGIATVENAVWPGETLLVKKKFIETADDDLEKKTRVVLSWRYPFASLLGGLFGLAEVRNVRNAGGRRITLAGGPKDQIEFTVVEVPEGGALAVRLGFLAGVMSPAGERPVIRSHWRFLCWQSWISGQFRFFEFVGPCRLVLVKKGALRVEHLLERAEGAAPAARVRQMAVVAFTPNLECRPVRAVSFWRYYAGYTKLFEAGFSGPGLVVHTTPIGATGAESCGLRLRLLKLFGL